MCGIVGILGNHEVGPVILDALKRLEYRGYDSAGIATVNGGALDRRRATGKLAALSDLLVENPIRGKAGIGHTRWATHGAPSTVNAHPHVSGPVAVVHNGIIENFRSLRKELEADGYRFSTETDTETVAHLVAREIARGATPEDAVARSLKRLDGAFALLFLFEGHDDLLIAARRGSPLAIGHGQGEMFVGSDALALAPMTRELTYLEEGDWAVIRRTGATIHDAGGAVVDRQVIHVAGVNAFADKGSHKHFMAKEIHEQPTVMAYALSHYTVTDANGVKPAPLALDFRDYDRVVIVACGTAYLAGMVAKYWFEQIARMPVEIDVASEFRYREPPVSPRTLAVFVSQSGETADTLAALRYMKGKAARIVGIVNVSESSIARESDLVLPIHAGVEIGVASTKAFTCQLTVLAVLAVMAARQTGQIDAAREGALMSALETVPGAMADLLATESRLGAICWELSKAQDVLFLGRGAMYPLALEGALKLKEISYIHAEGYASGELKHGPIALIDETVPVIVMAPTDPLFDKTVSNMHEVMARGGRILLLSDETGLAHAGQDVWERIRLPRVDPFVAPILYAVPAQLLAYHTAVTKGTDVDQPRNLAKSVTVE
ncbi:glutamine--fructose-6-phosphate transaminase (isomerizing) [Halovulum dunhuangense]|uniref:Glutamine--fructose-6-phosphate aminotransferase [isomerizing] n=1 Tax=Halovulum dunhuangense TaxID=1505036 RepID=A0A849L4M6_9RHOB|nr:glutamine--fructose-6-phosphate transaminase (isomerizing) [Halovulum dunhuangense]NNU81097.1 glutamine--fructose-6-phosphate transaminase (isomerizing) [Halovulum dunhuangense]